jgi:hypothetical protein
LRRLISSSRTDSLGDPGTAWWIPAFLLWLALAIFAFGSKAAMTGVFLFCYTCALFGFALFNFQGVADGADSSS